MPAPETLLITSQSSTQCPRIGPSHITIPYIFKGLDYSLNLYPDIGLRHANDLDILIPEQHFESIVEHLTKTMQTRNAPKENRHEAEKASAITFEINGVTLDIHRTPIMKHQTRLRTQALIEKGHRGRLGTCDVLFPDPQNRLFLWLHNFAKNFHPLPLHSLVDFVFILRCLMPDSNPAQWRKLEQLTEKWGLGNPFALALHYLEASTLWRGELPRLSRKNTHYRIDRWLRTQQKQTLYTQ